MSQRSLKLEVSRKGGRPKPVITKWDGKERSTWGEKANPNKTVNRLYSFEEGDYLFVTEHEWRYLRRSFPQLPPDPDPLTTVDIAFGLIGSPPSVPRYPHFFKVLSVSRHHATLAPIVVADKKRKIAYQVGEPFSADAARLNRLLRIAERSRGMMAMVTAGEFLMGLAVEAMSLAVSPASGALKQGFKLALKRRAPRIMARLAQAASKLGKPLTNAFAKGLVTFVETLAKSSALRRHFSAMSSDLAAGATLSPTPRYNARDKSLRDAVVQGAVEFGKVLVTELMTQIIGNAVSRNLRLERRVRYTLSQDTVFMDVIHAKFEKQARMWFYHFLLIDNVAVLVDIVNKAARDTSDAADFKSRVVEETRSALLSKAKRGAVDLAKTLKS
ncbi:MAG: hypothetical protein AAFV43_03475 [Planctomycetota bacterium]